MNRLLVFLKKNSKELLFVFVVLYFSDDTLLFGTNANRTLFWIHITVLGFLGLYLLLLEKRIERNNAILIGFFSFFSLLTLLINLDLSIKYVYEVILFFISALFVQHIGIKKFIKCFCFWVELFSLFAIALFVAAVLFPAAINSLPVVVNETGIRYHFAVFGFIEELGFSSIPRVYGIFREPGVFMVFIILAFIFETIYNKKPSIRRILVLSIGVLVTFSTGAYICLALAFILVILKMIVERDICFVKRMMFVLVLFSILCLGFVFYVGIDKLNSYVFNKLSVGNVSMDSRKGSIFGNFAIFSLNPLFGKGYSFFELHFTDYASIYGFEKAHNTNTFLKILSTHGLFYFALFTFGVFKMFVKNKDHKSLALLAFLLVLVVFSDEDLMVNAIIYLLSFYGYSKANESLIYDYKKHKKQSILSFSNYIDTKYESRIY